MAPQGRPAPGDQLRFGLLHSRRQADAAGLGQPFKPRSDVHPVAEDVAVLDHDVAHVDTNAELNAPLGRHGHVALGHAGLQLGRAAQRIHRSAELDEQAVARRLDEPSIVRRDLRIKQLGPDRPEPLERASLVRSDQPRISSYVGVKDRGETAGRGHRAAHPGRGIENGSTIAQLSGCDVRPRVSAQEPVARETALSVPGWQTLKASDRVTIAWRLVPDNACVLTKP